MENSKYKLDLFKVIKSVQFIKPKKLDTKIIAKIITLNIKTYNKIDDHGIINKLIYNLS